MFEQTNQVFQFIPWPLWILISVFDLVVRGISLWRSAKSSRKYWFVALLVVNSMGILPLIYLAFFDKKKKKS